MEQKNKVNDNINKEHPVAKFFGVMFTAICAFIIGFIVKGMIPAPAGGLPAGLLPPPPGDPLVKLESAMLGTLNPPVSFIGHVEPIQDVDLGARTSGYVTKVNFAEGAFVKAGDLLFEIDSESYEAMVSVRKAELAQAVAEVERAESFLKRLSASDARGITQADMDTAQSDVAGGKARVEQAKANLLLAEIDLKHCRIIAPIDGKIGKTIANIGDYVAPAMGSLARIIQLDPIRVVFSVTDREYIGIREKIAENELNDELRLRLKLPTGTIPDLIGVRDFEDNEMSFTTATLPIRIKFDNKDRFLIPNSYVTVLVDAKTPAQYPVVSQSALVIDAEGDSVYVIGEDGKAQKRQVKIGDIENGRVEIHSGVKAGERVVVEGVLGLAEGVKVRLAGDAPAPKEGKAASSTDEGVAKQ
ncbi:MAG: efflux RND transporter periplasmic adaptor subunit [Kiritimatiellae bacterium]|jgi:RND family efflux transporter MFP subunit|nr:efflux RND transporter periplasmic adaptor subunit [Kiritimatiellia bacterium]